MREGEKDFKGKFWVGQRVKADLSGFDYVPKARITTDGVGVIVKITGRFLRTPKLAQIRYKVRFDKGHLCGEENIFVPGEKLSKL